MVPTLLGIEISARLARAGESTAKIRDLVARLTSAPHQVVPLGVARARRVMEIAISGKLRAADATYVWLAGHARGIVLCTLDREMADRAAAFCKVIPP